MRYWTSISTRHGNGVSFLGRLAIPTYYYQNALYSPAGIASLQHPPLTRSLFPSATCLRTTTPTTGPFQGMECGEPTLEMEWQTAVRGLGIEFLRHGIRKVSSNEYPLYLDQRLTLRRSTRIPSPTTPPLPFPALPPHRVLNSFLPHLHTTH